MNHHWIPKSLNCRSYFVITKALFEKLDYIEKDISVVNLSSLSNESSRNISSFTNSSSVITQGSRLSLLFFITYIKNSVEERFERCRMYSVCLLTACCHL